MDDVRDIQDTIEAHQNLSENVVLDRDRFRLLSSRKKSNDQAISHLDTVGSKGNDKVLKEDQGRLDEDMKDIEKGFKSKVLKLNRMEQEFAGRTDVRTIDLKLLRDPEISSIIDKYLKNSSSS